MCHEDNIKLNDLIHVVDHFSADYKCVMSDFNFPNAATSQPRLTL